MRSGLTDEQQAIRLTGVGASESAAIVNRSRYAGSYDVYLRKTDPERAKKDSPVLQRGNYLEPSVLDWAEDQLGGLLSRNVGTLRHPSLNHVIASPDAMLVTSHGKDAVVQAKTHKFHVMAEYGEEGTDAIPDEELIQVTMEMGVTGLEVAWLPVLFGGDVFKMYRVEFRPALFEHVASAIETFWTTFVEPRRPPDLNPRQRAEYLARIFAIRKSKTVIAANDMAREVLQSLRETKSKLSELMTLKDGYENFLKTIIGNDYGIQAPGIGKALWVGGDASPSEQVDWESFAGSLVKLIEGLSVAPPEMAKDIQTLKGLYTSQRQTTSRKLMTYFSEGDL